MITIKNLQRKWKEFNLKDINLTIEKGEYFVILGPTAAGKTLLLELIAGFYIPDAGEIWIHRDNVTTVTPEDREVGFVYQDYALFPHFTVKENIEYGLRIKKIPKNKINKESQAMMDLLGITYLKDRYPATLSGGEKQKTAIGRALMLNPHILLLDEPLSALDAITKAGLQDELKKIHNESDITIIHVTHDQTEAMIMADRIGIMMEGQIVQTGTTQEIFNTPKNRMIADFVGTENVLEGHISKKIDGVAIIDIGSNEIFAISNLETGSKVHAFIRPEDIIISKEFQETSARNNLKTKIKKIIHLGAIVRIELDNGLVAFTTKQSAEELKLNTDEHIYASFKTTAVHIVRR